MAEAPTAGPPEAGAGVSFTLDGRPATARPGELLISAAERAGTYIPRFCYHPRMAPVGMCRMCLVEVSGPRGATLQPACFVTAAEGMEVVTTSDKVKKAQDGVLEFLLVNHPLDCPVCDKGGECPLQDQTLAYGPGESRFVEEKRHFEKPIAISDLVLLDRERCIQCARCTRFAEEVAGEAQIDFAGRGERVEVATFPDEPFSSYFSGNTVQICPVGALTATPYRFTARPWDLEQVESTCTTCSLGCRVAVQSSANRLTRLLGIDSDPVNQGWLCDKGRFVFESVNGDETAAGPVAPAVADEAVDVVPATAAQVESLPAVRGQFSGEAREAGASHTTRVTEPMVRKDGELVPVSWSEALAAAARGLAAARQAGGPGAVALLGGARSTNEGAYAWARLAKGVLGTDSVDAQLGDGLPAELVLSLPRATVDQACSARVVVLLTGDVREELPVLYLRLRRAALDGATSLLELAPQPTSLTRYAAVSLASRPGDAPDLVRALTGDDAAAAVLGGHPEGPAFTAGALARARTLLAAADVPAETSERPGGPGNTTPGAAVTPDAHRASGAHASEEPAIGGSHGGAPGRPGNTVVIILGRPSLAEHQGVVAEAARLLAAALPGARFLPALRRGNVHGALDMGLAPGVLPGRVSLPAGSDRFAGAWGTVPAGRGLDAAGILASLAGDADSRVRALVALGADVVGDFPDRDLATRALDAADLVVAVAGHRSPTVDRAHVVLPAAVAHERPGTTTNVEGRVTRLGQKLVAPGQAWPDWMIAVELAAELGGDLGATSIADLWDEIERLAPAYSGLTAALLESAAARDGMVVPLAGSSAGPAGTTPPEPIDPMALPGVESVERQGAPPRVGLTLLPDPPGAPSGPGNAVPPMLGDGGPVAGEAPRVPPVDSYSLRLVSVRRLYDSGSAVGGSPSLAPLVQPAVARANPYDLDRLGLTTGDPVRVRSSRAALVLPAEADPGVPRGVVSVAFNVPTPDGGPGAAALVDAAAAVTEVRMESVR